MSRRTFIAAAALVASCTAPEPTYKAPTNDEASAAYRAMLEGKIAAWKLSDRETGVSGPVDTPSEYASATVATVELVTNLGDIVSLRSSLASFVTVKVKSCDWGALDLDEIKEAEKPTYKVEARYSYRCSVETFHRAEGGGILAYARDVYLFQNGPGYSYIEIDHGPARYAREGELSA